MNKAEGVPYETAVLVLLTLSRGAESRKKILIALLSGPKNCSQIAKAVELDWWTVKKHLVSLMKEKLIKSSAFGSTKFYELSRAWVKRL
jgi:predicted transcriptional regulator